MAETAQVLEAPPVATKRCPGRPAKDDEGVLRIPREEVFAAAARERDEPGMKLALKEAVLARPKTRADCAGRERPCPFTTCRHHLFLDVTPNGGLQMNFPGTELEDVPETCALDLADKGGLTLEEVGALFNVTRERIRQIESKALRQVRRRAAQYGVVPDQDEG